jgi:nicotinate-nucleotide pyrophosphorylase (carboxylating)
MNSSHDLDQAIDRWFIEDIREGDHTTLGTIPHEATGSAVLLAKQDGIIAGVEVAGRIFRRFDREMQVTVFITDGQHVTVGDEVFRVSGRVHSILQCERLVLNVMQRMSGIATSTREYVRQVEGTGARILDTRKTTPGFRILEKEAVRIGGGMNHRHGLFDMILIKDNHIDFAGGIEEAILRTSGYLKEQGLNLQIEVEVRNLDDIEKVLKTGGVDCILLDNFSIAMTLEAVKRIRGRFKTESSGGITRGTIRDYAECGVDFISVGALTHQVYSLDLSLKANFK